MKHVVDILNVKVNVISKAELLKFISNELMTNSKHLINYVNIHALNIAFKDNEFRNVLNNSSIVFCDGFGVKLGAKILGNRISERMTPPDWIDELFQILENKKSKVYFLGDEQYVVNRFTEMVSSKFSTLNISGFNNGFFNKQGKENDEIVNEINNGITDVLITGMGMPLQEKWAFNNISKLNIKLIIATGALFRWYAKVDKRAPKIITDSGFEWLARLIVQPHKVWKRYLIGIPLFLFRILLQKYHIKK